MAIKIRRKGETGGTPNFKLDVMALVFLAAGAFLYLSLLSYHPHDPSFLSLTTGQTIHNWGGIIGSYIADSLLFLFGAGAYFIGSFFLLIALHFFFGVRDKVGIYEAILYLACVVFIAVIFQLASGVLEYGDIQMGAGGLFGGLVARLGVTYLGRPGTYLVVLFGALLTFAWGARLSIRQIGLWFYNTLIPLVRWAIPKFSVFYARLKKFLIKWWEARKTKEVKINEWKTPFTRNVVSPLSQLSPEARKHIMPFVQDLKESPSPVYKQIPILPGEPRILDRVDKKKSKPVSPQLEFQNIGESYQLPPVNLLDSDAQQQVIVDKESLKMNARLLEKKLLDFNVEGKVTEIHPGPVITMYEFQPAPGVKLSRIANLVDDLCLAMGGRSVRIVAPLPNKPAVGIEIPNNTPETVWLKDVIVDEKFQKGESRLTLAFGKNIEGIPFVTDLSKMPHLLVAGATGSGKSVSINSMILSILYKATPEEVRFVMVDPKMLELSSYEGIPHLLLPVVTHPKKAALALRWAVGEMERRYKILADLGARHILNYNRKIEKGAGDERNKISESNTENGESVKHEGKLPYIVIVIDELADLMMVSSRDVEESITRLAQMARAAGIHLIIATQRPSVDVITGVIKANFSARISFKVSSKHDSRTILDTIGAERLLGSGDMLFIPPGVNKMIRVHGAFITEAEVGRVVDFLKKQATPVYDESILKPSGFEGINGEDEEEADALYDQAVAIVADTKQASISLIQRRLRIGYNRAARMIERMEGDGIVSPPTTAGHRQVLVSSFEAPQ